MQNAGLFFFNISIHDGLFRNYSVTYAQVKKLFGNSCRLLDIGQMLKHETIFS